METVAVIGTGSMGRGLARVTHAEARAPSGAGMAVETCIGRLER